MKDFNAEHLKATISGAIDPDGGSVVTERLVAALDKAGYVVIPKELTETMLEAGVAAFYPACGECQETVKHAYDNMKEAFLEPGEHGEGVRFREAK